MKRQLLLAGLLRLAAALIVAPTPAKAAMWVGAEIGLNKMGTELYKYHPAKSSKIVITRQG